MKKRALCPLSGVHLTIKPILFMLFNLIVVNALIAGFYDVKLLKYINFK